MNERSSERFFDDLEPFDEFAGVADAGNYTPLPDGWVLATQTTSARPRRSRVAVTRR